MGSQGWPCWFGGESGDVQVGLVELCDGLGSAELFGGEVEGVGVALDGVVQAGGGVVEFTQLGGGGGAGVVAGEDLLQGFGRGRGVTVSGRTTLCGSKGEGGSGFGRVGEAVQFGEPDGAVGVFDVAEDAAGADGGELLIITD